MSINRYCRTEGQIRIHTAIWSIPQFLSFLANGKREILIQEIEDVESKTKFRMKIRLMGHSNDIVEIYYLTATPLFVKSVLTLCLKRYEERSIVMLEYQTIPANKWQYLTTLFKRDIASNEGKDTFLLGDNSLRLKFQFMVTNDVKIAKSSVPEAQLSNDFENLLQHGLFSDVVIKSCESVEYKAHKAVVASRSAVFRALFEHDMTESRTNVVESPFESEVLEEVLTFIYSDKAPKIDNIPEKLLAAADYYQLNRLKCLCEEAMQKNLTVQNCIDTLQLADLHSALALKHMCLEFIKDGNAKQITQTEGWAKIESVDLIKTIYQFIMTEGLDMDMDIK